MSHLLLATDTSGKNGSVALARVTPGQSGVEIVEVVPLAGGAFSAQLVPQIAALLEKHGYRKKDLGAFAVATGQVHSQGCAWAWLRSKRWPRRYRSLSPRFHCWRPSPGAVQRTARRAAGFWQRWMRAGATCISATTSSRARSACAANAC